MSGYVYSADGATISDIRSAIPRRLQRNLATGDWSAPTADNAADFGWYPVTVTGTDGGAGWALGPVTNTGPGIFERAWGFDQGRADAEAAETARQARGARAAATRQALDDRSDFYDTQPDAGTAAEGLAYINTIKDDQAQLFRVVADIIEVLDLD